MHDRGEVEEQRRQRVSMSPRKSSFYEFDDDMVFSDDDQEDEEVEEESSIPDAATPKSAVSIAEEGE